LNVLLAAPNNLRHLEGTCHHRGGGAGGVRRAAPTAIRERDVLLPLRESGDFLPRNAGTGADFFAISTRLSRTFRLRERVRLQGMVEAFNLLNRRNAVSINGNFGGGMYPIEPLPTFRQVTASGDPRSAQFAVRLLF
jgi:hypothetical protein